MLGSTKKAIAKQKILEMTLRRGDKPKGLIRSKCVKPSFEHGCSIKLLAILGRAISHF